MLAPETRELLLDLLRPPDGWRVDLAVGTTYTLDLHALLVAPLSFAMFDWALEDNGHIDPLATLEALRRHADRTTVFCQAGKIALPRAYQPLLVHLERCVVPVAPPNENAIVHPKVWMLRFARDDGSVHFRTLVLSRNLTFDTSWDTVVALEGRRLLASQEPSRPLADLLRGFVELGRSRLSTTRVNDLLEFADQLARVRFAPPEGFDDLEFLPFGLDPESRPLSQGHDRALVVSPFLGVDALSRLRSREGGRDVLVSRPEALDECGSDGLEGWETHVLADDRLESETLTAAVATNNPDAEVEVAGRGSGDPGSPGADANGDHDDRTLRGLHAKLYVFEDGDRVRVLSGSTNATSAGVGGNIEMLVELRGTRAEAGIDRFLDTNSRATSFGHLLTSYQPSDVAVDSYDSSEQLSADLDRACRALGRLAWVARVEDDQSRDLTTEPAGSVDGPQDDSRTHLLTLVGAGSLKMADTIGEVTCWRISAGRGHRVQLEKGSDGLVGRFGRVSEDGLTAFFAIEVTATLDGTRQSEQFVVNAELLGAPTDREERVLARLLRNRDDLLRYLQFLLADGSHGLHAMFESLAGGTGTWAKSRGVWRQPALMERLLTTLATDPSRLANVERVLADLRTAGRIEDLAPPGLEELWQVIDAVRRELEADPSDAAATPLDVKGGSA
ncbi:MAG: phospholipase D family protein [Dehalococcoidia bacterium]